MQKLVENATILGTTFYHTMATNGKLHLPAFVRPFRRFNASKEAILKSTVSSYNLRKVPAIKVLKAPPRSYFLGPFANTCKAEPASE
jgi:hypothetical protein